MTGLTLTEKQKKAKRNKVDAVLSELDAIYNWDIVYATDFMYAISDCMDALQTLKENQL